MKPYLDLLREIRTTGTAKAQRATLRSEGRKPDVLSVFGRQIRFDLTQGFPLVTTKRMPWFAIVHELLWFLSGSTNVRYLREHKVTIWDEWADENGELGPVYGKQWRSWEGADGKIADQITDLIKQIKTNPDSRRLIVSAWNVADLPKMALMPCHVLFQFYVALSNSAEGGERRTLSCELYQRSADVFLGVPFNIASYALLTMMIAQVCDLEPGEFIHTFGDVHIYSNHMEQVKLQLSRTPYALPSMKLNPSIKNIFDFTFDDFSLENYQSHPAIKAPVAV